nr:methylmalonyl-CoA mutase [Desulfobacterales bacterium]
MERPIKVILAKPGLDGHDDGIKVVTSPLRDAGMEVVFLWVGSIINAAVQEDVDVIGLSFHPLVHRRIVKDVVRLLKDKDLDDILLITGGSILDSDAEELKSEGVAEVFSMKSTLQEIIGYIQENIRG